MTACVSTEQLGGASFGGMPPKENFFQIQYSEITSEAIAQLQQATNTASRAELCYISLAFLPFCNSSIICSIDIHLCVVLDLHQSSVFHR